MTQDDIRANFLLALDRSEVEVSDWEAGFLENCLGQLNFSRKQAAIIDKMMGKYESRVDFTGKRRVSEEERAAQREAELETQANDILARGVMFEPSVAIKLYLEADRAKRQAMWPLLLESEREALIRSGKR